MTLTFTDNYLQRTGIAEHALKSQSPSLTGSEENLGYAAEVPYRCQTPLGTCKWDPERDGGTCKMAPRLFFRSASACTRHQLGWVPTRFQQSSDAFLAHLLVVSDPPPPLLLP